jgi:hypothetical protein
VIGGKAVKERATSIEPGALALNAEEIHPLEVDDEIDGRLWPNGNSTVCPRLTSACSTPDSAVSPRSCVLTHSDVGPTFGQNMCS